MQISLLAIGKLKQGPEQQLVETYCQRIPWQVNAKEMEAKPGFSGKKLKTAEGELLLKSIPNDAIVVVLDERGKTLTSIEFAQKLQHWQDEGYSKLTFLIGGADGHSHAVTQRADLLLSLGSMTWPHKLVRPMIAEQLYRAYTIQQNHPYHRE